MVATVKAFRFFAVGSAALATMLAALGSWVRINEAGMSCPDWPLCHGVLVPSMANGVLWEWSHRLIALLLGPMILGAILTGWNVRRRIAGVAPALVALAAVFVAQILVGGATIHLANSPASVVVHWATAMALLATLTTLAILAILAPPAGQRPGPGAASAAYPSAFAALAALVTACIGAFVSSSRAGLACPAVPACGDGSVFGTGVLQHAQMLHRLAAAIFLIVAAYAAWRAPRIRGGGASTFAVAGLALTVLQITLGIANVVWLLPMPLREAHAANAALTFLAFVIAAVLAVTEHLEPVAAASDRGLSTGAAVYAGPRR